MAEGAGLYTSQQPAGGLGGFPTVSLLIKAFLQQPEELGGEKEEEKKLLASG